jgi:hypothetical protein
LWLKLFTSFVMKAEGDCIGTENEEEEDEEREE